MPSIFFTPTERQVVAPVDLNQYATTMDTLQQKHENTITQFATMKQALANLPINPAEQGYLNQKVANLQNALDSRLQYGNAAFAFDDIVKEYGDIMSDPGMVGRLNAQKDYQAYLDNLNTRTDITEDTKEYYRENNQYYYNPTYNELGQEIGGSKWEPNSRPTSTVNISELMRRALQNVAKEKGASNQIYYMDANGQFTTDYNSSVDGVAYLSKSGSFERVTKEKLREAMNAEIANTPGAMASLQQDYAVSNWKYNKNGGEGISDVTDEKGVKLNFSQYLDKRLNGFYNSATYSNYSSSVSALDGLSLNAYKNRMLNTANGGDGSISDVLRSTTTTTPGGYYELSTNAVSSALAQRKAATETLRSIAEANNIRFDLTDIKGTYDRIKGFYGSTLPKEVVDAYWSYQDGVEKYNKLIPQGISGNVRNQFDFVSAMDAGVDLSLLKDDNGNLNPYAEELVKVINNIYKNKDAIKIQLTSPVQDVINSIPNYKDYGLEIKTDSNGAQYFSLPKEQAQNLARIGNAFSSFIPSLVPSLGVSNSGDYFSTAYALTRARNVYNEANKAMEKSIGNITTYIPTERVSEQDLVSSMAIQKVNSGKYTDIKNAREDSERSIDADLAGSHGERLNMLVGYDNLPAKGGYDGTQRHNIMQAIKEARSVDKEAVNIGWDKNTGKQLISVNITKKIKDNKNIMDLLKDAGVDAKTDIELVIDNLVNNEEKKDILNSSLFKGNVSLTQDEAAGIRDWTTVSGRSLVTDGQGNYAFTDGFTGTQATRAQAVGIKHQIDLFRNAKYIYDINNHDIPEEDSARWQTLLLEMVKAESLIDANAKSLSELSVNGQLILQDILKKFEED